MKELEKFKTFKEVFDEPTMRIISKLASDGYIDYLLGIISTGKEANVYLAKNPDGQNVAVKIYRTDTSSFENMKKYISGDYRFENAKSDKRNTVIIWAKKEFKNLELALKSKVIVPKPIICKRNVLIMEFIGENNNAAPTAKNAPPQNPKKWMKLILDSIKSLYKNTSLVHGDLSEYNILNFNETPVIIDMGQAVVKEHPQARYFLKKDIEHILNWFKRMKISVPDPEKVYKEIIETEL